MFFFVLRSSMNNTKTLGSHALINSFTFNSSKRNSKNNTKFFCIEIDTKDRGVSLRCVCYSIYKLRPFSFVSREYIFSIKRIVCSFFFDLGLTIREKKQERPSEWATAAENIKNNINIIHIENSLLRNIRSDTSKITVYIPLEFWIHFH
jgi:hypothetical protein